MPSFHDAARWIGYFVTDLGDTSILASMIIVASGYLLIQGDRKGAAFLSLAFFSGGACITLLKIYFIGCTPVLEHFAIHSPSGHTALSTAAFGSYGIWLASRLKRNQTIICLALLAALILTIALSRVMLGFHTMEEVVLGGAAGCLGISFAILVTRRWRNTQRVAMKPYFMLAVIVIFLFHGHHFQGEDWVQRHAAGLAEQFHFCRL